MPSTDSRAELRRLLRNALMLRLAVAVVLHLATPDDSFAPDQYTYHSWSDEMAKYWAGESYFYPQRLLESREPLGYYRIVASLYFLFGAWPLLPKLLNAAIGALTVRVVFDLALRMTASEAAALRAAKYTAYFPSLVLWSVLNIRDVWVVLLIVLVCRQSLALQERARFGSVVLLAVGVYAITQFRAYIFFAVTLPMLVSLLVRHRRNLVRNSVLGMVFAGIIIYADAAAGRSRRMRTIDWEDLNASRRWAATTAQSGFAQDADISSPGKALAFLPIGMTYFMLAPFPWMVASFRQAVTLPEMLFYYSLLPALARGLHIAVTERLRESLMILLICMGLSLGYAVGQGNIGTIYRHRAQVLPMFLIFAALGVERRRALQAARAVRAS